MRCNGGGPRDAIVSVACREKGWRGTSCGFGLACDFRSRREAF